jgi:hypothetical protein
MDGEYSLDVITVDGIADSDYLDRVADLLYGHEELLIDPLLGLNDDGSLNVSFALAAQSPSEAVERAHAAIEVLLAVMLEAGPLRGPTTEEEAHGAQLFKMALNPVDGREKVYA